MQILVTGCHGYIGSVLTPMLEAEGHDVVGLDTDFYKDCTFGPASPAVPYLRRDIREVERQDFLGVDAVIHLAALSNDLLGHLQPELTHEINHRASVRLARLAKEAKIPRFVFSSSCSMYGASGDQILNEDAPLNPVTAYGESKVWADRDIADLADENFTPIVLRNATAYGPSPRLRLDIVLNDLVAAAFVTGRIVVKSDGTPWRPLVHVEDICRAFLAVLTAPRSAVYKQPFNVGQTAENYRVSELAEFVRAGVPGSEIEYSPGGGPDKRCYRVNCDKFAAAIPAFRPKWNVRQGVRHLYDAYRSAGLSAEDLEGSRYKRLGTLSDLLHRNLLDETLRWPAKPAARPQAVPQN